MLFIEIIPNLYIGDQEIIKNINKLNINSVINCTKDLHFLGKYNEYTLDIKNNLEKYEIIKMYEYLDETVEFIYKNIMNDKAILVFCENGKFEQKDLYIENGVFVDKMPKNAQVFKPNH